MEEIISTISAITMILRKGMINECVQCTRTPKTKSTMYASTHDCATFPTCSFAMVFVFKRSGLSLGLYIYLWIPERQFAFTERKRHLCTGLASTDQSPSLLTHAHTHTHTHTHTNTHTHDKIHFFKYKISNLNARLCNGRDKTRNALFGSPFLC